MRSTTFLPALERALSHREHMEKLSKELAVASDATLPEHIRQDAITDAKFHLAMARLRLDEESTNV